MLLTEILHFTFLNSSKSMVHLDTDSGEEYHDAKESRSRLSPHHLDARLSPHHMDGRLSPRHMDGRLSPRHMMETSIAPLCMEPRETKEKGR